LGDEPVSSSNLKKESGQNGATAGLPGSLSSSPPTATPASSAGPGSISKAITNDSTELLKKLQSIADAAKAECTSSKAAVETLKQEKEALQAESRSEIAKLKDSLELSQSQLKAARESAANSEAQYRRNVAETLATVKKEKDDEIAALRASLDDARAAENATRAEAATSKSAEIDQLRTEVERLKTENAQSGKERSASEATQKEAKAKSDAEIYRLRKEVLDLKTLADSTMTNAKNAADAIEAEILALKQAVTVSKEAAVETQVKARAAEVSLAEARAANAELNKRHAALESQLAAQGLELAGRVSEAEAATAAMTKAIKERDTALEAAAAAQAALDAVKTSEIKAEAAAAAAQAERSAAAATSAENARAETLAQLEVALQKAASTGQEAELAAANAAAARAELGTLKAHLASASAAWDLERAELRAAAEGANQQAMAQGAEIAKLQQHIAAADAAQKAAEDQAYHTKANLEAERERLMGQCQQAVARVNQLEAQVAVAQSTEDAMQKEASRLHVTLAARESEIADKAAQLVAATEAASFANDGRVAAETTAQAAQAAEAAARSAQSEAQAAAERSFFAAQEAAKESAVAQAVQEAAQADRKTALEAQEHTQHQFDTVSKELEAMKAAASASHETLHATLEAERSARKESEEALQSLQAEHTEASALAVKTAERLATAENAVAQGAHAAATAAMDQERAAKEALDVAVAEAVANATAAAQFRADVAETALQEKAAAELSSAVAAAEAAGEAKFNEAIALAAERAQLAEAAAESTLAAEKEHAAAQLQLAVAAAEESAKTAATEASKAKELESAMVQVSLELEAAKESASLAEAAKFKNAAEAAEAAEAQRIEFERAWAQGAAKFDEALASAHVELERERQFRESSEEAAAASAASHKVELERAMLDSSATNEAREADLENALAAVKETCAQNTALEAEKVAAIEANQALREEFDAFRLWSGEENARKDSRLDELEKERNEAIQSATDLAAATKAQAESDDATILALQEQLHDAASSLSLTRDELEQANLLHEQAVSARDELQASLTAADECSKIDNAQFTEELNRIRAERTQAQLEATSAQETTKSAVQLSTTLEAKLAELTDLHNSALSSKTLHEAETAKLQWTVDELEKTVSTLRSEIQSLEESNNPTIQALKTELDASITKVASDTDAYSKKEKDFMVEIDSLKKSLLEQEELNSTMSLELRDTSVRVANDDSEMATLKSKNDELTETIARLEATVEDTNRAAAREAEDLSSALQRAEATLAFERAQLESKHADAIESIEADIAVRIELAVANARAEADRAAELRFEKERLAHSEELESQLHEARAASFELANAAKDEFEGVIAELERKLQEQELVYSEKEAKIKEAADSCAMEAQKSHDDAIRKMKQQHDAMLEKLHDGFKHDVAKLEETHSKRTTQEQEALQSVMEEAGQLRAELQNAQAVLAKVDASQESMKSVITDSEESQARQTDEISRLQSKVTQLESELRSAASINLSMDGPSIDGLKSSPSAPTTSSLVANRNFRTPDAKAAGFDTPSELETSQIEAMAYKRALERALAVISIDDSENSAVVTPPTPKSAATYRAIAAAARAKAAARSLRAKTARSAVKAAAVAQSPSRSPTPRQIALSAGTNL
jgi:hypothetical protein